MREWINKHGTAIVATREPYAIGEIIFVADRFTDNTFEDIEHPFIVKSQKSVNEFVAQCLILNIHDLNWISAYTHFYEVTTD